MYRIFRTKDFEKSFKRINDSGKLKEQARKNLTEVINTLAKGEKLSLNYKNHQLKGKLSRYRECHIKGDLLLIYQTRKDELLLVLVDMGTHSYLSL